MTAESFDSSKVQGNAQHGRCRILSVLLLPLLEPASIALYGRYQIFPSDSAFSLALSLSLPAPILDDIVVTPPNLQHKSSDLCSHSKLRAPM